MQCLCLICCHNPWWNVSWETWIPLWHVQKKTLRWVSCSLAFLIEMTNEKKKKKKRILWNNQEKQLVNGWTATGKCFFFKCALEKFFLIQYSVLKHELNWLVHLKKKSDLFSFLCLNYFINCYSFNLFMVKHEKPKCLCMKK